MWEWLDDRWHFAGQPVHAGCSMELCWPDKTWERVRIESADCGRRLSAHFQYHGESLRVTLITPDNIYYDVRW